jgi:hypothetical protein
MVDFASVKLEFDETLGYIRQDLRYLLDKHSSLNYTIAGEAQGVSLNVHQTFYRKNADP